MATPRATSDRSADALPTSWQRLLALSGIPFAVLLVVGFFLSGGDAPDYTAADQEWTNWADGNESKGRIGAFLTLIAGFVFLHFAGTIRSVLGTAEATVRGSGQLARTAFAGAAAVSVVPAWSFRNPGPCWWASRRVGRLARRAGSSGVQHPSSARLARLSALARMGVAALGVRCYAPG
jgi:succinate dehydrogenase/fumarate reductase cytochrome b subunit